MFFQLSSCFGPKAKLISVQKIVRKQPVSSIFGYRKRPLVPQTGRTPRGGKSGGVAKRNVQLGHVSASPLQLGVTQFVNWAKP